MTDTNSSNDRLILHQNVDINSNEYFSYDISFREWNRRPCVMEMPLRNLQEKCLSSGLFQRFIMVCRMIIAVVLHLLIICSNWWCHFLFLKTSFYNGSAVFCEMCRSASCPGVNKLMLQFWDNICLSCRLNHLNKCSRWDEWQDMGALMIAKPF